MKKIFAFLLFSFVSVGFSQEIGDIEWKEIKDGYWQIISYGDYKGKPFPGNSMVVDTEKGLILIDTPWGEEPTKKLLKEIKQKLGKPVIKAILTHYHPDSAGGIAILKEANIPTYSYYKTWKKLFKNKNRISSDSVLYKNTTVFDIGNNKNMKVYYPGHGHTEDNIVVFFPEDKVLFGGCFLKSADTNNLGYIKEADTRKWYLSLRKMQTRFITPVKNVLLVPGHGEAAENLISHTIRLLIDHRKENKGKKESKEVTTSENKQIHHLTSSAVEMDETDQFPNQFLGVWKGTMYIHNNYVLKDSVEVRFTAAPTKKNDTFIWKTEYLSKIFPVTKDYKLIVKDREKGIYELDEGNDIVLNMYHLKNKLYSMFKVNGNYLTSSTELVGDNIIFEVTMGKEFNETGGVTNYSFQNIQRVVLSKI